MTATIPIVIISCSVFVCWALLLFAIPQQLLSIFRYKLWRIRDNTVDAVFAGDIADTEVVRLFIASIEWTILNASAVTPWRFMVRKSTPRQHVVKFREYVNEGIRKLPDSDRERLEELLMEFKLACWRHLKRGSPSGWVIGAIARPLQFIRGVSKLIDSASSLFVAYIFALGDGFFRDSSKSHRNDTRSVATCY